MTKVLLDMFLVMQLLLQLLRGAAADRVPAVIVFGDSTADTGNNNFIQTLLRGNYTPYGRDFASQRLGLPPAVPAYLDPGHGIHQLASGVSFASAGSGFDDITAQIFVSFPCNF
jgi:hypothetical protein